MRGAALLLIPVVALAIGAACGGGDGERSVSGVIIEVKAPSLTELETFTLRSDDGERLVFRVAPDARPEPEEGFVPGHLRSHAVAAERVTVFYREEGGQLLATRLVHD